MIQKIFFNFFWVLFKPVLAYFFSLKVEYQTDLKKLKGPLIIASNHASWIDPVLIGIVFPFNSKIFPTCYATWWKYYYFPLFTPLLWLVGAFPVRPRVGLDRALFVANKILESGGVVGIFPTGRRTRLYDKNNPPQPKRGTAFLAIKNHTPVLPVKIEGNIGMKFRNFFFKKYKLKLKIGKPFYLPYQNASNPELLNEPANYIMKKILEL